MDCKIYWNDLSLNHSKLEIVKELNPAVRFGFARQKFQAQTPFELNPIYPANFQNSDFGRLLPRPARGGARLQQGF